MVPALLPRGPAAGVARSVPAASTPSRGITKGALLPAQPQLATASLAGVRAGTDALALLMLLPVPPGDVRPETGAQSRWWWVRREDAIARRCPSGLPFPREGVQDPDGQRGEAQALAAKPQWG